MSLADLWSGNSIEWLTLASIPLMAGGVGLVTNWITIGFLYPAKFPDLITYPGWQGIISRNSLPIARSLSQNILKKLGSASQFYEHFGQEQMAIQVETTLRPCLDSMIDEVMQKNSNILWENLPITLKNRFYAQVHKKMPTVITHLIEEFGDNINWLTDLEEVTLDAVKSDNTIIERIFMECSEREFRYNISAGFVFGVFTGLIGLACWVSFGQWAVIPLTGLAAGLLSNWLSLRLLVRPLQPARTLISPFRGRYLKRQNEISETFASIISTEVITPYYFMRVLFEGSKSKQTFLTVRRHAGLLIENISIRAFTQLTLGPSGYVNIKQSFAKKIADLFVEPFADPHFNESRARTLAPVLAAKMKNLQPQDFQKILFPVANDKFKLLLMNAAIGLVAGFVQFHFMFR